MSWSIRYFSRLLGRNPVRSLLCLLLAALLAFAFGLLTVLRGIYGELYQQVEVRPKITGGITYERAERIAGSGYVRSPYYETVMRGVVVPQISNRETSYLELIFTNDLGERVSDQIEWLTGWDEQSAMETKQAVCILSSAVAEANGLALGDTVLILEADWYIHLTANVKTGEEEVQVFENRWERRPSATIAGIILQDSGNQVYLPASAWQKFLSLFETDFLLDLAEYTLEDYDRVEEFAQYAQDVMSKSAKRLRLHMDTSYADRIYSIHQLIETLYPLTIAAALLLGCVLPGLTVLHASRQISVLRALGAKAGKCVGIYTLAQVLCALAGLALGLALVLAVQRPELWAVLKPFGVYLAAHLAACAVGSGVFAWFCARKRVLEQLQAKE